MQLSDKNIEDFQRIYKQKFNVDLDKKSALNKAIQLLNMMKALSNADIEEQSRRLRLKKEPEGFHFPSGKSYSCPICHNSIKGEEAWYDHYGMKCLVCQKALNAGNIPKFVFANRDGWYSMSDLEQKFELRPILIKKLTREGKIKAVIIPREDGKPHDYIFLKRDNPKLAELDPNTTPSGIRKITRHKNKLREKELQDWLNKTNEPPITVPSSASSADRYHPSN